MQETTDKPNIFNYATKELSQDAVICWLIEWSSYEGQEYEKLRECGQEFVKALFAKHGTEVPENCEKPQIWQQNEGIDVLARIGDYVLLIEDKTGTGDHSNQLDCYYKLVRCGKTAAGKVPNEENIIPIYLKTETQSLHDKLRIESSTEYKVFERTDFLNVIEPYREAHPIISDFYDYLKPKEAATNSWEGWQKIGNEIEGINYQSCQGFFRKLESQLYVLNSDSGLVGFDKKDSAETAPNTGQKDLPWGWDWVNNPSGGFLGFWWYFRTIVSCNQNVKIYLQLEIKPKEPETKKPGSEKLCFKVGVKTSDKSLLDEIKWDCHDRILNAGNNLLCKPDVMRIGGTMTVAQWGKDGQNPWLAFNPNGVLDIQNTVNNLVKAQSILDEVVVNK